jgi:hypothetical protein
MDAFAKLSWPDKVSLGWFLIDALTHLFIEGSYMYFAYQPGGAMASTNPLSMIWKEYGKADLRWMTERDPDVLAVEFPTVFLMGPGALFMVYAILNKTSWRHLLCVVVCVIELIGGWYTFAPEWLTGSPSLDTSRFVYLYVYLAFMNLLWVWVPIILLFDSSKRIIQACDISKASSRPNLIDGWWFDVIFYSVALYSVLVPACLLFAR